MQTTLVDALRMSVSLYQNGHYDQAKENCRRIVNAYPDCGDAWHLLGRCILKEDNLDVARIIFERARELLPDNIQVLDYLASVQYKTCHFDDCYATLHTMKEHPDAPAHVPFSLGKVEKRLQALRHMEGILAWRPISLALETVTVCNSRCVFCAYRKLPRPKTVMSMDLFKKICREYSEMGGGFLGFNPLMSDPLVDPLYFERLEWIVHNHHDITPHLFTNLIALPRFSDEQVLFMLSHLDYIDISLGGLTREDYAVMFGVDRFDRVHESLERLARLNDRLHWRCRLTLHFRTQKEEEVRLSPEVAALRKRGFTVADIINSFSDWGGILQASDLPEGCSLAAFNNRLKRVACVAPSLFLSILADGRVIACSCMDGKEEYIVGNVGEQTLESVWKSDKLQEFRNSFKENRIPSLCEKCSYYGEYSRLCSRPLMANYRITYDFWEFFRISDGSDN